MHKRISTSTERNQAEPEECWPAGPSQSLLPTKEERPGPQGTRRTKKMWEKSQRGQEIKRQHGKQNIEPFTESAKKKTPNQKHSKSLGLNKYVHLKDMNKMAQESNTARTISVMRRGPLSRPLIFGPQQIKEI